MKKKDLKEFILDLITRIKGAFLITIDEEGLPYIRSIENLRNLDKFPPSSKVFIDKLDNFLVYISTNTSSEKVKDIINNANVALYYYRPKKYKDVIIRGCTEITDILKIKKKIWMNRMKIYYPKGVVEPDFTLL
ncbi:MAG: pyridoxamine 5'-phosphate oxidase family protein [Promethearchaeota archaeon]